jgi:fructose-bisphosphate aldolase class I
MMNTDMRAVMGSGQGFIAALDQSGGSTPKALRLYGINEDEYSGDQEMFDKIHEMRTRIMTDPAFTGDRVIAAILFEDTMDRTVDGKGSAEYLWDVKRVVPIIKVDKGLADEANGVQLMKPIPNLDALLQKAASHGVFGTKMRSVIKSYDPVGIKAIVDQQFEIGQQILAAGLVPILEPEVDINAADKDKIEQLLLEELLAHLADIPEGSQVMFKLTIPSQDNLYQPLIDHPKSLRVVALSGGYSRDESCERLARNTGLIASFSRALTEGLSAQQSDGEFTAMLDATIGQIYAASTT